MQCIGLKFLPGNRPKIYQPSKSDQNGMLPSANLSPPAILHQSLHTRYRWKAKTFINNAVVDFVKFRAGCGVIQKRQLTFFYFIFCAEVTKKELLKMMCDNDVEEIKLPWTDARWELFNRQGEDDAGLEDRGKFVGLNFDAEEQKGRAGVSKPRIGNVQDLKVAYLKWLKENRPEKLLCQFETKMKEEGFRILWTPPYCPKLQPIKLFWAAGKNHVADHFDTNTTMKDVVRRLQDGWYGNDHRLQPRDIEFKTKTRCEALVKKCRASGDKEYIPLCPGLEGRIGNLTVDEAHERDTSEIPIDSLVIDLTKDIEIEEENGGEWV